MSLILIDGSALVYRAYYAFTNRPLSTASGEQTSVVFGFLNSVLRVIESYQPRYLAVVFDVKAPTFRHVIYSDYKANRKPMPDDLAAQLPRLRELLDAWGVGVLEQAGFEADDIMATLARRSVAVCERTWFYTGDKDFMQLLDERTAMLKPGRRGDAITPFSADDVRRQFKLEPSQLVDVFALAGDSSDNIPGAPGVGVKTATKLVQQFGSLDDLYAQLDDKRLTPRLRRVLGENREKVYLSRRLFVIDDDMSLELDWPRLRTCLPTSARVNDLLQQLELRRLPSLIQRLTRNQAVAASVVPAPTGPESAVVEEPAAEETQAAAATKEKSREAGGGGVKPEDDLRELERRGYVICNNANALRSYLGKLGEGSALAVDTETDSLRDDAARLVGISLAGDRAGAAYIPILSRELSEEQSGAGVLFPEARERSELSWVRTLLGPVLSDPRRLKIGQNLKFDEWVLYRHGLPLAGRRFDTMVAAYVLDPGRQRYGLGELAREFLGEEMIPYTDLFAAADRKRDILEVPLSRLAIYAAEDADVTFRLYGVLSRALAESGLEGLFVDVEMPLSAVLFRMEHNGVKIDSRFLGKLQEKFGEALQVLEAKIHAAAGAEFNVQSPQQLSHILFEKLKLKPLKKTTTGWSTDVSVLTTLAEKHPLPALMLEFRQLAKLQNTYVEALPQLINTETGLIHTSFNQAVAATGRLSSSDPNLQNIPVRTELGRSIRQAFVPRESGHLFLSADYSQVELRLLAHLSGDVALTRAFHAGGDVHRRTAALIAGVPENEVTPEMRGRAKAINFGVIYGMGARALGKQIDVTTKEAKQFIETYFATYPGVRGFIEEAKEKARRQGYVETLLGRRRLLPDILSPNNRLRSFSERIAVNTPIQGTAADVIKMAMIRVDQRLQQERLVSMLLLQVHDELLFEVPQVELDLMSELVRDCMENVIELTVPLLVDIHTGSNWAEAHG